jgi:glutaredoxin
MEKIEEANDKYIIISKDNCTYCEMVYELLNDKFIDYKVIKVETLTDDELKEIRPKEAKKYPFVFEDKKYIGSYSELKKILNNKIHNGKL